MNLNYQSHIRTFKLCFVLCIFYYRVSEALKERDNALDELARLTNEMKILQEDNQQLQKRIETLGAALQDTQQNLQQVSEELDKQMYNGQVVALLKEEVYKQKCEITTLKVRFLNFSTLNFT